MKLAWFGVLWALPLPLLALYLDASARASGFSIHEAIAAVEDRPVHVWFLAQPLVLGALCAVFGQLRSQRIHRLETLEREREQSDRDLKASVGHRVALDEAVRRLVSRVSHELKTPLTAIHGYAEMLVGGRLGPVNARQARALSVMLRAVAREQRLVEDLLGYARIEEGDFALEREPVDVVELASRTIEDASDRAAAREVSLRLVAPPRPVVVAANATQLRHVLSHLVSNAVKFATRGGHAEVAIEVERVEDAGGPRERAHIVVTDDGPGVPPALREKVFQRFVQLEDGDTRQHGGIGIGLSIVKGILDAHGIPILLDDRPGGGARFRFAFPLARAEALAATAR